MIFRRPRIYIDFHIKFMFYASLMLAGLVLIITGGLKAIVGSSIKNNMFYAEVVNYTVPLVKTIAFDEESLSEGEFTIRDAILQSIGIKINNPIAVLGREVSYFRTLPLSKASDNQLKLNFTFNPFALEDSMVLKELPESDASNVPEDIRNPSEPNKIVSIYDPNLKKDLNLSSPEVLIYHTHTTESYQPYGNDEDDETKNICAVGTEVKNELEKNYGISVIHDRTIHNSTYIQSYDRSKETMDKYMKHYGDFKLIIDLHRDSEAAKSSVTTIMNGKNAAKIMFVMSRGNPRFKENQAVVNRLLDISRKMNPNFDRGILYYNNKTNHFGAERSNNAVLIEVGSVVNSIDEAKESGKYIARIIGEYINGR